MEMNERTFAYVEDSIVMLRSIWRLVRLSPTYYLHGRARGCRVHIGKSGWVYTVLRFEREKQWWRHLSEEQRDEGARLSLLVGIKCLGVVIGRWLTADDRNIDTHTKAIPTRAG